MKKLVVIVLIASYLSFPLMLIADDCMEGDCENGVGTGFTDDNKVYEGEWKDSMPHGKGKLYQSKTEIIEGVWDKGELVEEEREKEYKDTDAEK